MIIIMLINTNYDYYQDNLLLDYNKLLYINL